MRLSLPSLLLCCACVAPETGSGELQFDVPAFVDGPRPVVQNIGVTAPRGLSIIGAEVVLFADDGDGRFEPHEEIRRHTGTLTKPSGHLRFGSWDVPAGMSNPTLLWRVDTTKGTVQRAMRVN